MMVTNSLFTKIQNDANSLINTSYMKEMIMLHYEMLMAIYEKNPGHFKTIFKSNRFILGISLMSIYSTEDFATIDKVKSFCNKLNLSSINSINAFILYLKVTGRIATKKYSDDKRRLLFEPTGKAYAEITELLSTMITPINKFTGAGAHKTPNTKESIDKFFMRYSHVVFDKLFLHDIVPESRCFIMKDAGHIIILNILTKYYRSNSCVINCNPYYYANECGVSRSHLRRVLLDAERNGLITLSRSTSDIIIHEKFVKVAEKYMSFYFAAINYCQQI